MLRSRVTHNGTANFFDREARALEEDFLKVHANVYGHATCQRRDAEAKDHVARPRRRNELQGQHLVFCMVIQRAPVVQELSKEAALGLLAPCILFCFS